MNTLRRGPLNRPKMFIPNLVFCSFWKHRLPKMYTNELLKCSKNDISDAEIPISANFVSKIIPKHSMIGTKLDWKAIYYYSVVVRFKKGFADGVNRNKFNLEFIYINLKYYLSKRIISNHNWIYDILFISAPYLYANKLDVIWSCYIRQQEWNEYLKFIFDPNLNVK